MGYFLVDYENVQSGSPFCGIDMLSAEDEVLFFIQSVLKRLRNITGNS